MSAEQGVRLSSGSEGVARRVSLGFARRVLTPARLRLLRWIRRLKPDSIYALAKGMRRRKEAVLEDLRWLRRAGLVELRPGVANGRKRMAPRVRVSRVAVTVEL